MIQTLRNMWRNIWVKLTQTPHTHYPTQQTLKKPETFNLQTEDSSIRLTNTSPHVSVHLKVTRIDFHQQLDKLLKTASK